MMKIVLLIGFIGFCASDVSLYNRPPPSSWGAYPNSQPPAGEYGAPPLPTAAVEITLENVEFGGQVVEINTPSHTPSNAYLPPKPDQFGQLRKPTPSTKAFLPKESSPKPFRSPLNAGEVFITTQQSAKLQNRPSVFASSQHLPQFQEIKQFKSIAAAQHAPSNEYGPPSNPNPYPYPQPSSQPPFPPPAVHETVDESSFADNDEDLATADPAVIAVANANGQYYILGKDNTLKRVVYRTSRNQEDNINNGFTAHLRYSLVEPIRDPIYGYDDQGHLVRLYNKK